MISSSQEAQFASAISAVIDEASANPKSFVETIELQIPLKNYDQRDRRFAGSVVLNNKVRNKNPSCVVIADQEHIYECQAKGIEFTDIEGLKKFKKDKKLIADWCTYPFFLKWHLVISYLDQQYDYYLASESCIRQIPRVLGPMLGKISKFPR